MLRTGSSYNADVAPGLNILVGANDSGKTAVIDVPRFVLWTRGDVYLRLCRDDFPVKPDGTSVTEFLPRCTFDGLTPDEKTGFLEWCSNEGGTLRLHVCLRATLRKTPGGGNSVNEQDGKIAHDAGIVSSGSRITRLTFCPELCET